MQAAQLRWVLYAVAAGLLLVALWLAPPAGGGDASPVVQAMPRRAATAATAATAKATNPANPANAAVAGLPLQLQPRTAQPVVWDPFAAAGLLQWPAAPAVPAAQPAAGAQPEGDTAEPAPPLPFSFLGRWTEQGRTTVFLRRGDKTIPITGLGRIDDRYHVRAIDEQGLLLQHLPSGSTQALRFDAPAPAAAGAAAQAAPPPPGAPLSGDPMSDN